jgi:hypothetical protein
MLADSLAKYPTPSTVRGLDSEETVALSIAIAAEESWSRGAARRETTRETLALLYQIDSESSPVDSDTNPRLRTQSGKAAVHHTHQRYSTTHDWRPT